MKTDHGIHVDLISGVTGRKPSDYHTEDGIFVRMPHGNFAVRLLTPQPTNVAVSLDGTQLLKTLVNPGQLVMLNQDADGKSLAFTERSQRTAAPMLVVVAADATDGEGDAETKVKAPAEPVADTNGLVVVSLQFAEQPRTKQAPGRKAGPTEVVVFQMNPPGDHERVLAANLRGVIPPEGVTKSGCSCCK